MAKVWVDPVKRGKPKYVSERDARILVAIGKYRYRPVEPAPPKPADPLEDMAYQDLLKLAAERGVEPESRKKDDVLRALRYNTRDMRAAE